MDVKLGLLFISSIQTGLSEMETVVDGGKAQFLPILMTINPLNADFFQSFFSTDSRVLVIRGFGTKSSVRILGNKSVKDH